MAANEGVLGDLHVLVARVLAERLGDDELCTAADINAAIKFLKDNNITAAPEANSHLEELKNKVESQSDVPALDDADLQEALNNIVSFPGGVNAGTG